MGRLTERNGDTVLYVGNRCRYPGLECAGTMRVAAVRECMERLADYEDTGMEPEELREVKQALVDTMPRLVECFVANVPYLVDQITAAIELMTPEEIKNLLQKCQQEN